MRRAFPALVWLLASAVLLHGADAPAYRTDADGPSNKKVLRPDGKPLEWFKLVEGEQKIWRRLDGQNQVPKIMANVKFDDGIEASSPQAKAAA